MSIIKFVASSDNTITDAYKLFSKDRAYIANMGAADSLEMFSIYESGSDTQKSRILLNFPINKISQNRAAGIIPASGSVNFILKLYNVEHPETLPKNYYCVIKAVSGSWDEGNGLDLDNYLDNGASGSVGYGSNWLFKNSSAWTQPGGDYYSGYQKTFYFDTGLEDLEVDVTEIVEAQLDNTISADGIAIMLSGSYENGNNNTTYYTKRFSARSSEYFYKKPCIEARWESLIKDDRGSFFYESPNLSTQDNTQNIYFYNKVNGSLKDIPSNVIPYVKISDENNNVLTSSIPTTKILTGVYKASFIMTGSEEKELYDTWYSSSNQYFEGTIQTKIRTFSDTEVSDEYVFNITNLKNSYASTDKPTFTIFARNKNWSPNIYKIANNSINTLIFNNLYYKIFRIVDNLTIVDYGIEPIPYTKCSYNKNGNYFELDMSMLETGYSYGIKLMIKNDNLKVELPNIYKFKVE